MHVSALVNCVLFGAILLLISVGSCIARRSFVSPYEGPTTQTKTELRNCVPSIVNATCDEDNITLVFTLLPTTSPQVTLLLAEYRGNTMVITWKSREPVGTAKLYYMGRNKERRASFALLHSVTKLESITASSLGEKFFKSSSSQLPSKARWISSLVTPKDGHFILSSSLEFILQSLKDSMIQRLEIPGRIEGPQPFLLRSMPELQYINISNNETEELVVGTSPSIQKIQHLILQKNTFNEISHDLKQLGHVKYLDISHNRNMLRHHNLWFIKIALQKLEWCKYELKLTSHIPVEENTRPLILVQVEPRDGVTIPQHLKHHMLTKTYLECPEDDRDTARAKYQRLNNAPSPSLYQQSKDAVEVSVPLETNDQGLIPLSSATERQMNNISQKV